MRWNAREEIEELKYQLEHLKKIISYLDAELCFYKQRPIYTMTPGLPAPGLKNE
jgi:hypothetical protein